MKIENPAYRVIGDHHSTGPFIFTCEHASNALHGIEPTASDRVLLEDHWGWDIGAARITEALADYLKSPAVLSQFSRLLIDPNRPLASPTLIVERCGDVPVSFNQGLSDDERHQRIDGLYTAYHDAVDRVVKARLLHGPAHLCSIHSFTRDYLGQKRPMHIGVLFDEHEEEAEAVGQALEKAGFKVALNAPYSGKGGAFVYSIMRHGRGNQVPFIELEIRNDLIADAAQVADVARRVGDALRVFTPDGHA